MGGGFARRLFPLLLLASALFIWHSSGALPERVASHFDGPGNANGFMPRDSYRWFMLAFGVGVPAVLTWIIAAVYGSGARINIPHREWWLAPERREETVAWLVQHTHWFGCGLVVFLAYVHWLVVQANQLQPPHLAAPRIITALVAFGLGLALWVSAMLRKFLRRPG